MKSPSIFELGLAVVESVDGKLALADTTEVFVGSKYGALRCVEEVDFASSNNDVVGSRFGTDVATDGKQVGYRTMDLDSWLSRKYAS